MKLEYQIQLGDFNLAFLRQLRERFGNVELEIKVKPCSEKSKSLIQSELGEDRFWELIDSLDWTKVGNDENVVAPLVKVLSELKIEDIQAFQEILAEKLFLLDGQAYAESIGEFSYSSKNSFFSVDNFLYVRCCVVANGKQFYEEVLSNPKKMPKNIDFEPLLYVCQEACEKKNISSELFPTLFDIETFSNINAWKSLAL